MIVEAETGLGPWGGILVLLAVLCGAAFFWFMSRSRVVLALASALVGAAVLAAPVILQTKPTGLNRPFEVIVVHDDLSKSGFLQHHGFTRGEYRAPDRAIVPLVRRPDWPRTATVIVNDSKRLVTLRRYHYASSSSISAGTPLLEVVFPGETAVIEGYVDAVEDAGTPPPRSMKANAPVAMLDILYRSTEPYDPVRDGGREKWLAERDSERGQIFIRP